MGRRCARSCVAVQSQRASAEREVSLRGGVGGSGCGSRFTTPSQGTARPLRLGARLGGGNAAAQGPGGVSGSDFACQHHRLPIRHAGGRKVRWSRLIALRRPGCEILGARKHAGQPAEPQSPGLPSWSTAESIRVRLGEKPVPHPTGSCQDNCGLR